jgi:hypothetical protein
VVDFARTVAAGQTIRIDFLGYDADQDPLQFELISQPEHGQWTLSEGTFTFTPESGYTGTQEIRYRAFDGSLFSEAGVLRLATHANPYTISFAHATSTVVEQDGLLAISATLDRPADTAISLAVTIAGYDGARSTLERQLVFLPGMIAAHLQLPLQDDTRYEPHPDRLEVTIHGQVGVSLGPIVQHIVSVFDNDPKPTVAFVDPWRTVPESNNLEGITLGLSAPSDEIVTAVVSISAGMSATRNVDFLAPQSFNVEFLPGQTRKTLPIRIVQDSLPESRELIRADIGAVTGGQRTADFNRSRYLMHIEDDDTSVVSLVEASQWIKADGTAISEGDQVTVTARRAGGNIGQSLSVPFSIVSNGADLGSDFTYSGAATFEFLPGQVTATKIFSILKDSLVEQFEAFTVSLVAGSYALGDLSSSYVGISDSDSVTSSLLLSRSEVSEGKLAGANRQVTVTVVLSTPSTTTVTVPISASSSTISGYATRGVDYLFDTSDFVFPPGTTVLSRQLTVIDDDLFEPTEIVRLSLGDAAFSGTFWRDQRIAELQILNDDFGVQVSGPSTVREGDGQFKIRLTKDSPETSGFVTVYLYGTAKFDGSSPDLALVSPTVNQPQSFNLFFGTGETVKDLTFQIIDDSEFETPKQLTVEVSRFHSTTQLGTHRVTIHDNDSPPTLSIGSLRNFTLVGSLETTSIPITLSSPSPIPTTVSFTLAGSAKLDDDYKLLNVNPSQLQIVIPPGSSEGTIELFIDPSTLRLEDREIIVSVVGAINGVVPALPPTARKTILATQRHPLFPYLAPSSADASKQLASFSAGALALPAHPPTGTYNAHSSINSALTNAEIGDIIPSALAGINGSQGLLSGSSVFIDVNNNGIWDYLDTNQNGRQDADEFLEPAAATSLDGAAVLYLPDWLDADNSGVVEPHEGRLVLTVGVDTSTGLQWEIPLSAPLGVFNVTPLTTILDTLMRNHNFTLETASDRLRSAVGLQNYDFTKAATLYQIQGGDRLAEQAYVQQVQVSSAAIMIGRLVAGRSGGGFLSAAQATQDAIAALVATPKTSLNLTERAVIRSLLLSSGRLLPTPFTTSELNDFSSFIADRLAAYQSFNFTSFSNPSDYLQHLSRIKKVINGQLGDDLFQVGAGNKSLPSMLVEYTGSAFTSLVQSQTAGNTIPSAVGVGNAVVVEGNSGTSVLRFEVGITGQHSSPVSVSYTTHATQPNSTSFLPTSGILTWDVGDSASKFVEVIVSGDSQSEADEMVRLSLSDPSGAVIRVLHGYGFILNDDPVVISPQMGTATPQVTTIGRTPESLSILRNNQVLRTGEFALGTDVIIGGVPDQPNTSLFEFSPPLTGDTYTLYGGTHHDTASILGGLYSSMIFGGVAGESHEFTLQDRSHNRNHLRLNDYESVLTDVSALDTLHFRAGKSISSLRLDDADPASTGMMVLMSPDGGLPRLSFSNPRSSVTIVSFNANLDFQTSSLDSAFSGQVRVVQGGLQFTASTLTTNSPSGSLAGTFSTQDPLFESGFEVCLVDDEGCETDSPFTIVGNQLRTAGSLAALPPGTTSVRVRVSNSNGEFLEQVITFAIHAPTDSTRPISSVQPLPLHATSLAIPIVIAGSDPTGPEGVSSGVKEYALYVATNSTPFTYYATLPAQTPTTTFFATSNQTYYFRSVARDHAGNTELDTGADTYTRVGDFDKPSTQVVSAVPTPAGRIDLQVSGFDIGGSALARFDVFVSIDQGPPQLVASLSAGTANSTGQYSASTSYAALADGEPHNYRFYSIGHDSRGNVEDAPPQADVQLTTAYSPPAQLAMAGIDVQLGARQRSYVRYVDLLFNTANGMAALLSEGRVRVEKFAIDATDVTPGTGATVASALAQIGLDSRLRLDFGANGLGGSRTSTAGDGFYRIQVDVNGDGDFNDAGEAFEFYRLLGDANGDGVVDAVDTSVVDSMFGRLGDNLDGDLNGDGIVNSTDKSLTTRTYRGRRIASHLFDMLDD